MEYIKGKAAFGIHYAFRIMLLTYLALLIIEEVRAGFVSNYFNLSYLLILVMALGIASLFSEQRKYEDGPKQETSHIALLAISAFVILKIKTGDLGWISWFISTVVAALSGLMAYLIFTEKIETAEEPPSLLLRPTAPTAILCGVALTILMIFLAIFLGIGTAIKIIMGIPYILLLPGLAMTFLLFAKKSIGIVERMALAMALSIAVVPIVAFFQRLIGLKVSFANLLLASTAVTALTLLAIFLERKLNHHRDGTLFEEHLVDFYIGQREK